MEATCLSSDYHPLRLLPSGPGETSNPRKRKRTRNNNITSLLVSNPKHTRKPDPSAPKITRPCTECGRKFWSWKALFGHMRCHPEREWRGIVPPPNFRRYEDDSEEDHEVAAYLLMLANGLPLQQEYSDGRFECSSCKKVFGSHQALGGHRASHKNVKGCYAITKSVDGEEFEGNCCSEDNNNGHKCSICFRIFSSGQALGGHMRCHWEKADEPSRVFAFDLNLSAPVQDDDDDTSVACSSSPPLELRLGL